MQPGALRQDWGRREGLCNPGVCKNNHPAMRAPALQSGRTFSTPRCGAPKGSSPHSFSGGAVFSQTPVSVRVQTLTRGGFRHDDEVPSPFGRETRHTPNLKQQIQKNRKRRRAINTTNRNKRRQRSTSSSDRHRMKRGLQRSALHTEDVSCGMLCAHTDFSSACPV